MFVQVIKGRVRDTDRLHAALDQWSGQLADGAPGWLGSTAGVTADGEFVGLARFDSKESAQRNSGRPEQSRWWEEISKLFTGDVSFRDSDDVVADVQGNPDAAHFVQVMHGRGSDPGRARELLSENSDEWAAFRPEVLGSVAVGHDGGAYTMALYFTSEQAARAGEAKEPPPDIRAQMEEMNKLNVGEPEFLDIRDPWLYSPR
jgi:hypothetical protein